MIQFQTALSKLQELKLSKLSQELLYTYVQNQLIPNKVASFQSALQLYFTNNKVYKHNYSQLVAKNRPIKKIMSNIHRLEHFKGIYRGRRQLTN